MSNNKEIKLSLAITFVFMFLLSFTTVEKESVEGKHLFILSGQSNMDKLDPEISFIPIVEAEFGKNHVIVVKDALGGQPIRRWYKKWKPAHGDVPESNGDLYDQLMDKVNKAIKGEKISTVTFAWMQGERDARERQGEVYAASLKGLFDQISEDMGRKDIHFIIGRISDFDLKNEKYPHWTMVREAQVDVAKTYPHCALINTDDLNGNINDLHYSDEGYKVFGKRLADKAIEMIKSEGKGETAMSVPFAVEEHARSAQSNNIRNYLVRVAGEITHNSLAGNNSLDDWKNRRSEHHDQLVEMLGLEDVPLKGQRPPLNVHVTGTLHEKGYRVEKLYYESLPGLYVPANLYIPDKLKKPAPAVLYVCGHSPTQKVYYQAQLQKLVQLGFVAMVIETIQFGEVRGVHHGEYSKGWFQWYSRGYNPGGVEAWNGIRAIDLLCQRPEVDVQRIGVTGNSGGGSQSWYIAALDPRIKAVAPSCGGGTLESQIRQRTIDDQCDCMMPVNTYLQDFQDIGALIAPRPLLVAESNRDLYYSIESVRELYKQVKNIYNLFGAMDSISMVEAQGKHGYDPVSRTTIFSFFVKHLMGKDIPPGRIGDIDESEKAMLSAGELRVYVDGAPKDDRTTTIQDSFVKLPESPSINNAGDMETYRSKVINFLKKKTFNAFPKTPTSLSPRLEFQFRDHSPFLTNVFSFVPEKDWRLKVEIRWRGKPGDVPNTMLVLHNPDDKGRFPSNVVQAPDSTWNIAYLDTRGVGETGWNPDMQWHIRRAAAWTGRTVASMRVYDVQRCLEFLRSLPGVDGDKIGIAASGEMAVVAMYAALLDGNISTVILKDPPSTQNAPGSPDGKGETIEMLNCLRITDLPQVAGLLYPAKVKVIGQMPQSYNWAKTVYEKLDAGNLFEVLEK
jgi:cephalosporin-C deacetylase-like acetyl esterase